MGGLMQGANFVEGMQNRSHARGLADEAFSMKKETHNQQTKLNGFKIEEAETKLLLSDLDRDLRSMEETGETFSQEQWKKYKPLGFDKFNNQDWREENKDAGALLHRGMTTGEWGEGALDAFNTTFYDELRGREKEDGLKRKIIGVKETEDGRSVAILEITGKDGKKYNAPLTKGGTADDEDSLVLFDDEKLDEIYKVQMHRADMAYAIDKAGGDPKKLAAVMRKIAFKQTPKEAPGLDSVYDKSTGRDQKVVWDGSKYVPIGGNKVDYGKNSKDPRAGGGASSGDSDDSAIIDWKEYRDKRAAALKEGDPAMLDQVDSMFESTYGFSVNDFNITRKQFEKDGLYGNPTVQQVRAVVRARKEAEAELMKSQANGEGNEIEDGLASQPPPREIAPNPRIAELEQLMEDPIYPDNARAKFEQEYNQLVAKHYGSNQSKPPQKLSRQDKYKQDLEFIQNQMANAQSEEERARLSQLLVKTMTEFNKGPGLNDAAHMAAL